jgi:hypothetical protein
VVDLFVADIYIAEVSSAHNVCAKGHYLAIVSTIVETDNPQIEIKPGLDLLGPILDMFVSVTDLFVPLEDGTKDHCYISKSYDATSHFETTTDDVRDIYGRIMGKPLVVKEKMRPTQVQTPLPPFPRSDDAGGGAKFVCCLILEDGLSTLTFCCHVKHLSIGPSKINLRQI